MTVAISTCCGARADSVCGLWQCSNCFDQCDIKTLEPYEREPLDDEPDQGADDRNDPGIPQVGE